MHLISVAWTGLEREREGIQISMQFYVFHLLIKTETERNWNVGSSTLHVFRLFFSPGTSKRNFFFIWQVVCVLLRTRGMGQRRSPCKAFSVTDIETIEELKVFHFQSFDIGTERELERSYRQSVNKFWRFGVNQRLRLYAVFYSTIQDRCWMDLSTVY